MKPLLMPTSASAVQPGILCVKSHKTALACTHFNSGNPNKTAPKMSSPEPQAQNSHSSSQPASHQTHTNTQKWPNARLFLLV